MSENNQTQKQKLSLAEQVAKAAEGKDTSVPADVIIQKGQSLKTKSISGYGQTDLDENILRARIKFCIILLQKVGKPANQSNVMKLLGFNKNTQYTLLTNEKRFVEELFKDMSYDQQSPENRKDPTITEHTYDTIGSLIIGSEVYTLNQLLFAQHLKPIFDERLNDPIKIVNPNNISIGSKDAISSTDLMAGLIWMVLDNRKYFHHSMSLQNTYKYCEYLNDLIRTIAYSGTVHSRNNSYDYLHRMDKRYQFLGLIERYGSYRTGIRSYKYRYTETLEDIMKEVVELFKKISIAPSTEVIENSDIIIEKDMLNKLNTRDLYILLNELDGYNEKKGYVIKNSSTIKDKQNSRVYSLFTGIKSETRKVLGFINYDISTCMQTIVAAFVDMTKYPVHQQLLDDKHTFRANLSEELNVDINMVKKIISSADNGKKHNRIRHKSITLCKYVDESDTLINEFYEVIKRTNPDMIEIAEHFANDLLEYDGKDEKGNMKFKRLGVNPYSRFFFIWTQIERKIRHVMMSCFDGFVHEVHDAVYSKQSIDTSILEQAVASQVGINVKIEH